MPQTELPRKRSNPPVRSNSSYRPAQHERRTPSKLSRRNPRGKCTERPSTKRSKAKHRSETYDSGREVNVNLCGVSRPSLSRECDYDEHQPEQRRGCPRHEEIEIRPSLQFI